MTKGECVTVKYGILKPPSGREVGFAKQNSEGERVTVKYGVSAAFSEPYHEIHLRNITHIPKSLVTLSPPPLTRSPLPEGAIYVGTLCSS